MYETISRLYKDGIIDKNGLQNAVNKKFITADEMKDIIAKYSK